jgi:hypothetical protein
MTTNHGNAVSADEVSGRAPWARPELKRLRAGDAEVAGNPNADAPVFS